MHVAQSNVNKLSHKISIYNWDTGIRGWGIDYCATCLLPVALRGCWFISLDVQYIKLISGVKNLLGVLITRENPPISEEKVIYQMEKMF